MSATECYDWSKDVALPTDEDVARVLRTSELLPVAWGDGKPKGQAADLPPHYTQLDVMRTFARQVSGGRFPHNPDLGGWFGWDGALLVGGGPAR
jgi:hypothetical protein